jgi:hypothetical protein
MEARYIGMIIYKGKFIITPDSKSVDGLIRIEKRYNDRTKDWDHITLLGYDNVIYFKIKGKDIILDSGPTDELGLFFKNATFIRD